MQATIRINCEGCGRYLNQLKIDTADMPDDLQKRINEVILKHRKECPFYGAGIRTDVFGRMRNE